MSGVTVQTMIAFTSDGIDPALGERAAGGLDRHVGGRHSGLGDVALPDPDAFHDPLVVGVDQLFQVLLGQHVGRSVAAERSDFRLGQCGLFL